MKIARVIWLEDIAEKIRRKHGVNQSEAVEVLKNQPLFRFVEKGYRRGENVYVALGQTNSRRYLAVFFVHKSGNQALIISARDMTDSERRKYEER